MTREAGKMRTGPHWAAWGKKPPSGTSCRPWKDSQKLSPDLAVSHSSGLEEHRLRDGPYQPHKGWGPAGEEAAPRRERSGRRTQQRVHTFSPQEVNLLALPGGTG